MTDQPMNAASDRERPVGELIRQLSEETSLLVRQELALARTELQEKGKRAGVGAGLLGGAGVTGLVALIALMVAVVAALDTGMATWLAALITTVIFGVIAAVQVALGRSRLQDAGPPVPEQTTDSVKEDVEWAKTRARSART
ncbi:MAG: phage holin family protein [Solirubrobacterales bacterium]|nr:phage holin family protein [Solirubrobacterales bacterium]